MAELPDKSSAFVDWYLEVVEAANLTDKRYGVKGMNVWTPYGFRARRELDRVMIREIEATASVAVEFPTLISQTEFQKEGEHIKGFDAQVYWVTRGGATPLDVPLVLRPTSETAMYPIFALWVRSHRDLPLNVYQIVNTFRYETKTTRPFLRVREIHFFEEHTCQVDEAAATARVRSNLDAFGKMARSFALPFVAVRRPEWDKFPGAFYSVALDIPIGGAKTLQIGSVHHYRENFSRPYEIAYETTDGAQRFVHQTTFGLSERLIGAIVAVHGDSKGAIFPTEIAPYQVVIVPILSGETRESVLAFSESVEARLSKAGLRVFLDRSEERPGAKYLPLGDPGRAAPSRDRGPGGRRRYGDGGEPPRREAAARSGVARGGGPIGARGVRPGALRACPERLPKLVQPRDEPRRARELGHRPDPPMVREGSVRARDRDRDRRGPARDPGRGAPDPATGPRALPRLRGGPRNRLGPRRPADVTDRVR